MKKLGFVFLALVLSTSCSKETPKLVPPPKPNEARKNIGTATFNPKVDVIFVIDNSGSMQGHQTNLSQNVARFTAGLQKNVILDYHIGVTTSDTDGNYDDGTDGRLFGNIPYVDRSMPNAMTVLANNMKVGTNGSATETFFDPLFLLFDPKNVAGTNKGFYRDDAQLAVVFITDAEDQSERMDAQQIYDFLLTAKHGDKSMLLTYAVYIPSTIPDDDCTRDESTLPDRLEQFLSLSAASSFSLCDLDYGDKLAKLGDDLAKRISRVILLDRSPVIGSIKVDYGTQSIPMDPIKGWSYDPERNAIVLGLNMEWTPQAVGTRLSISFDANEMVIPKKK